MAVSRNRAKRWVREIFQTHNLGQGFIVVIRSGFLELGFKDISLNFNKVLFQLNKDFLFIKRT